MTPPARAPDPATKPTAHGPVLALLAGIPLAIAGYVAGVMAFFIGLSMDRSDQFPPILRLVQAIIGWGGMAAFVIGVLLVVGSFAWWLWRVLVRVTAPLRSRH